MRKFLCILFLSIFSLSLLVTCAVVDDFGCCAANARYSLPQTVLLDINAVNNTENPVTIKIRHKYFLDSLSEKDDYTGPWSSSFDLESGETASIGLEQAERWDENSEWYDEGFVLLGKDDEYHRIKDEKQLQFLFLYSSFEIDVSAGGETLFTIFGYTDPADLLWEQDRIQKCFGLYISSKRLCKLNFYGQQKELNYEYIYCSCDDASCSCGQSYCLSFNPEENPPGFSLPVDLTINSDGTYSLTFRDILQN